MSRAPYEGPAPSRGERLRLVYGAQVGPMSCRFLLVVIDDVIGTGSRSCVVGLAYLAERMAANRRTVSRALEALVGLGVVTMTDRVRRDGSTASREYAIDWRRLAELMPAQQEFDFEGGRRPTTDRAGRVRPRLRGRARFRSGARAPGWTICQGGGDKLSPRSDPLRPDPKNNDERTGRDHAPVKPAVAVALRLAGREAAGAVDRLVGEGFDREDAERLCRDARARHGHDDPGLLGAVAGAVENAQHLQGLGRLTSRRGYIAAALRGGWALMPGVSAARERSERRVAEEAARRKAEEARRRECEALSAELEAERRGVDAVCAGLTAEEFRRILGDALTRQPECVRSYIARADRGGKDVSRLFRARAIVANVVTEEAQPCR